MEPTYFRAPDQLRRWLSTHRAGSAELLVGFYKRASGKQTITYQEALDEALSFGWIDGVRKGVDEERYTIRFTPRKPTSYWSAVNTTRARHLIRLGRMEAAGLAAFERRDETRTKLYSFEQATVKFTIAQQKTFRANGKAWEFFKAQPPSYRRAATWWVVSAKKAQTSEWRLEALIEHSARRVRLPQLTPPARRPPTP